MCANMLRRYVGSQKLSEMLQQPYDLYKAGWADAYLMGLINQVMIIFIITVIITTIIIVIITVIIIMGGCLPHETDQPGLTLS